MASVSNVTHLIGNTPLVKLQRLPGADSATVLVKLESRNPGGSVKDRISLGLIQAGEKAGLLKSGGTIVEATSGNTGVALAMVAAAKGYRCILVMPEGMSIERQQLMQMYGAEVVLTPGTEAMTGAVYRARQIAADNPDYYYSQQFENPVNPEIHRQTTAQEIWSVTDGNIDAFVCGVGTGGTISGVADVIKNRNPMFKAIAVEPAESPVISGGTPGPHLIQGLGAGFIPKNLEVYLLDGIELVSSPEALAMRKRLFAEEGIMAGISSGANVCGALRIAEQLGKGKTVVTMIHDTGERYLSLT